MNTLATSALTVGGFLFALFIWLIIQSDPLDGEPFVVVEIKDRSQVLKNTEMAALDRYAPVIQIAPPTTQRPAVQKGVAFDGIAENAPMREHAESRTTPSSTAFLPNPMAGHRGAVIVEPDKLSPAPVRALIEYTKFGPLPKVSEDGRTPSQIYARPSLLPARPQPGEPARIAILINGMGLSAVETHEAIQKLPAQVTLAFGPYGSNLQGWVRKARENGHEVMLQVPLEPFDYPDNDPGPHTLLTGLPPDENIKRLQWLMARFTGYMGLTNAMGAKFMTAKEAVKPIMRELKLRGLIFFNTTVSPRSSAGRVAAAVGLGFGSAHILIDQDETIDDIDNALARLETMALERGLAVGVASGLPITVRRIVKWSKTLSKRGIVLVPVSTAVKAQQRT